MTDEWKVTEQTIQAVLMHWLMVEKHHRIAIPNSNTFFPWESDLLTVTRAGLSHEFEIKLNIYDYRRDAQKHKHHFISIENGFWHSDRSPNYFWYATYGFEIEPPAHAGWLLITFDAAQSNNNWRRWGWGVEVKKEAPRLKTSKITKQQEAMISSLLTWRMMHAYRDKYLRHTDAPINYATTLEE